MAIVVSFPITCAETMVTDSGITGFTFPGIIDDPGWTSGSIISPIPARGPDPSHRKSLAIFSIPTAIDLSSPEAETTASSVLCAWK